MNMAKTLAVLSIMAIGSTLLAAPNLSVGTWTNITPTAAFPLTDRYFLGLAIDPSNTSVIYAGQCGNGVWKSTDGGSNWNRLGNPSEIPANYGDTITTYLDNPASIEVDPQNPLHLYATDPAWCGSGKTLGFWVSTDGGAHWIMPKGFRDATAQPGGSLDAGMMTVDPGDFNHVLISLHYLPDPQFGFLETTDGGATFTVHKLPFTVPAGTMGINFLHDPVHNVGNSSTWLLTTENPGFWRTTDAGATWEKVADFQGKHGGFDSRLCYTTNGTVYAGGEPYPTKSTNNGKTWQQITDHMYGYYYGVYSDGEKLYTTSCIGTNSTIVASPETDGNTWTNHSTMDNAPAPLRFDATNNIMYAVSMTGGVYATKTKLTTNAIVTASQKAPQRMQLTNNKMVTLGSRTMMNIGSHKDVTLYNINGVALGRVKAGENGLAAINRTTVRGQVLVVR